MELVKAKQTTPVLAFRWRDQYGHHWLPSKMETRHLFYTLRMIWNHTMPKEARLEPYKRYAFGPTYTKEYLKEAIRHLTTELSTREHMEPGWVKELKMMIEWLSFYQLPHKE